MLTLTEAAGAFLAQKVDEAKAAGAPEGVAARIVVEGPGRTLRFDHARPGDATFAHEGRTVLLLDQEASQSLAGRTLDVEDTDEGPRLRML